MNNARRGERGRRPRAIPNPLRPLRGQRDATAGQGLYLFVQPSGTRSWVHGSSSAPELGLGSAQLVPLAEAREKALANRKLAREGGDPLAEKRRAEKTPTFADAARRVLDQQRAGWRQQPAPEKLAGEPGTLRLPPHRHTPPVTSADVLSH